MSDKKLTLTRKFKLIVSDKETVSALFATIEANNNAMNLVSDFVWLSKNKNAKDIHDTLYRELRSRFNLSSQMACIAIRYVVSHYKALDEKLKLYNHNYSKPVFKSKQYELVYNRDYSFNPITNLFSISIIGKGRVHFNCLSDRKNDINLERIRELYLTRGLKPGAIKLIYKNNEFYLLIPVTQKFQTPNPLQINGISGCDRGINKIVAVDMGNQRKIIDGKKIKHMRGQQKALRKELQIRGTSAARRKIKKIGNRENRCVAGASQ